MDESKGRDMGKVILGVILIVAGNFLALKAFPTISKAPSAAASAPGSMLAQAYELKQLHEQMGMMEAGLANAFKMLMLSLCMVNIGAFSLYLSGEKKTSE